MRRTIPLRRKLLALGLAPIAMLAVAIACLLAAGGWRLAHYVRERNDTSIREQLARAVRDAQLLCEASHAELSRRVLHNMEVARYVLGRSGSFSLGRGTIAWRAISQADRSARDVALPPLELGGAWLGQNADPARPSPVVDEVRRLVGGHATIFQRMDARGDMLRVATTLVIGGRRAVGTFIPAVEADGTPNPVIATVLRGERFQGRAFVVNAWYVTVYEPLRDARGDVIGMIFTGLRQDTLDGIRAAVQGMRFGQTGDMVVLSGKGAQRGGYVISPDGHHDGDSVWDQRDASGYFVRDLVSRALALAPGETTFVSYTVHRPTEAAPQDRLAAIAYFEPWDWIIIGGMKREEATRTTRLVLRAIGLSVGGTLLLALGFLGAAAWAASRAAARIAGPVEGLARVAHGIARGEVQQRIEHRGHDEIGALADAFRETVSYIAGVAEAAERLGRGDLAFCIVARSPADLLSRSLENARAAVAASVARLHARNQDLKQVLDSVGEGFLAMDPQGAISQERSAVVDQWFGPVRPDEPIWSYLGREDERFAHEMERRWRALVGGAAREEDLAHMPSRLQRGDRSFDLAYRLIEAKGRIERIILVVSDVTLALAKERSERRMRAELQQAQKMEAVGRLASGIAHDFNNILTVILSCSKFLLEELPSGDPRREDAEEIRGAGERAARLVAQLLAFARKSPGHPVLTDLNAVVNGLEKLVRRSIGEDVTVSFALAPGPWRLRIDPGQLEQVLMNLIVNARDAMPRGGQLRIETANGEFPPGGDAVQAGRCVVLRVSDTGSGIAPEVLSYIFDPFFTTKSQGKGTGLGLSTVLGIVQQASGTIAVSSEPGRGTTFTLRFPCCDEGARPEAPQETSRAAEGGGTVVLLVEDEDGIRRVAQRALSRHGYRVIDARNADEALLRFASERVEVVVTDVVMPGLSGPELAVRLRLARPGLPILFMTGYSDRQGPWGAGDVVLAKPFTEESLVRALHEVLAKGGRAASVPDTPAANRPQRAAGG